MTQHKRPRRESTTALKKEIADLKAQNLALQKKVDAKNASIASKKTPRKISWKPLAVWLCICLATVLLVLGNIFFWAGNTLINTNRYVAAVGPLIEKPAIQTAIASYTTNQLFNNVNVQGYVQSTLPPRAAVLAPQLTTQLKSYTQTSINALLKSPKVQSYWYSSLTKRHQAIINFSKSYQGNGTIDVSDIYSQLSTRLESTKLSFLANKQLPSKVGSIKVTTVGWLPAVHKLSNNIGLYQTLATLLLLGFSVLAVWLSSARRRTVIRLGSIFAIAMLITLLATRIVRGLIVSDVAPSYQSAVQVAFDTVMHSFRTQTVSILLLSILVVIIAWLSGPYKSAKAIKSRVSTLLSGHLHQSIFGHGENVLTLFVGRYKRYIQWFSVLIIALIMLIVQLSPKLVIIYAVIVLVIILVIELLASPTKANKKVAR